MDASVSRAATGNNSAWAGFGSRAASVRADADANSSCAPAGVAPACAKRCERESDGSQSGERAGHVEAFPAECRGVLCRACLALRRAATSAGLDFNACAAGPTALNRVVVWAYRRRQDRGAGRVVTKLVGRLRDLCAWWRAGGRSLRPLRRRGFEPQELAEATHQTSVLTRLIGVDEQVETLRDR